MRRLLAVLGQDVSASLSPLLHEAAARRLGLDVAYVPVSCPDGAYFRRAVDALITLGARGCNVTIPFKSHALELAHELGREAKEIGAVNVLSFDGDRIRGDNTDGPALIEVLSRIPEVNRRRAQILGAGGAARAAAWALAELKTSEVWVSARDPSAARAVADRFGARAKDLSEPEPVDLVISALPKDRELAERCLADWVAPSPSLWVIDLAYGDLETASPLSLAAAARGWSTFDGRWMLVEQAALALARWTGGELSAIREAMRDALRGRDKSAGPL